MTNSLPLIHLGWLPFFQHQLSLQEWESSIPARIIEQHKSNIILGGQAGVFSYPMHPNLPALTVGDWVLFDASKRFSRRLERTSCFKRKQAGSGQSEQLIAANVDTALIVCSLNKDFNLNRIERYLALVNEAGADPVIVLSKSDLTNSVTPFVQSTLAISQNAPVIAMNCLHSSVTEQLSPWLKPGQTTAVIGSSGVGKSTLINQLIDGGKQQTQSIRADDDKGRHTTTSRSLIATRYNGLVLDTPGMREIQLVDCVEGISKTFVDIEKIAEHCRFHDCTHQTEPNCAVLQAIQENRLDERRVANFLKLKKEEQRNSISLAESRAKDRAKGKFYKTTLADSNKLKGRP